MGMGWGGVAGYTVQMPRQRVWGWAGGGVSQYLVKLNKRREIKSEANALFSVLLLWIFKLDGFFLCVGGSRAELLENLCFVWKNIVKPCCSGSKAKDSLIKKKPCVYRRA